ncbi:hypothetical protein [Nocardioides euryhalodurans]|uniref:Tyr recombinase domain-containing protein n=1 Tax=Nocardioides euryhalodurans TaxID=2518370 RepID=A0A4P7GNV5_9ACTN|nr:hypothetical protein [Nocardioides euryhalodurans]QBR93763.1 hypothetical protein EXE57_16880 [Nocardioides euryhalodurans]
MGREERLAGSVTPARVERARQESAAFVTFRARLSLDESPEAVTLYLAALADQDLSGRQMRERLRLLDLDRRLLGLRPWLQDPDVRLFLRGLLANKPVGERHSHYDPLYLELMHASVDACRVLNPDQQRALAAHLTVEATNIPATALARLRWADIHLTRQGIDIRVTSKIGRGADTTTTYTVEATPSDPRCLVAAVRALRALGGGQYVFGVEGRPIDIQWLRSRLTVADPLAPTPAQVRDQALLLIGYLAGLRTSEAMTLRQRDVEFHGRGLVLAIAGRIRLTYLPSAPDPAYDAANAWTAWLELLDEHGLLDPDGLAFHATNFRVIFSKGIRESGLNRVVHQRTEEAGLSGRFVWTSLRTGMMRTAIRNDVRSYSIAAHADLLSLGSVQRHERRENLLADGNVAGRLGL